MDTTSNKTIPVKKDTSSHKTPGIPCPENGSDYNPVCTTNIYNDTLKFDSSGYAVVHDSVEGRILGRSFNWNKPLLPLQLGIKRTKKRLKPILDPM